MSIILGVDPGSRTTGYGVIKVVGNKHLYVTSGCINTKGDHVAERLAQIFSGITTIIQKYQPDQFAIEKVFVNRNVVSALKLGQARGVAIVAAANHALNFSEYSPREIKKSVVGYGAADKTQVQQMVKSLLKLSDVPQADAADALAVALCHAQVSRSLLSFL